MEKKNEDMEAETVFRLAKELAAELTRRDDHRAVISAMLETLHEGGAGAMEVIKVFSAALLLMARAQDAAAGAGAIVAIKLLNCLMPGRPVAEIADAALDMLKKTANGEDDDAPAIRIVVIHGRRED